MLYKGRWMAVASSVLALAASAAPACASEGSPASGIVGDLGQFLATMLVFVALLMILGRWAWKPLVAQLRAREQGIADTIAKAQQREKEAHELMEQYRQRLEQAQAEAKEMMAQSRKDASSDREQLLAAAREEAHKTVAQATQEIDQAKHDALRDLYEKTSHLAADIAGRLIRRKLTPQDHAQLVSQSLDEIRSQAGGR